LPAIGAWSILGREDPAIGLIDGGVWSALLDIGAAVGPLNFGENLDVSGFPRLLLLYTWRRPGEVQVCSRSPFGGNVTGSGREVVRGGKKHQTGICSLTSGSRRRPRLDDCFSSITAPRLNGGVRRTAANSSGRHSLPAAFRRYRSSRLLRWRLTSTAYCSSPQLPYVTSRPTIETSRFTPSPSTPTT
jgi:hypothetical protein